MKNGPAKKTVLPHWGMEIHLCLGISSAFATHARLQKELLQLHIMEIAKAFAARAKAGQKPKVTMVFESFDEEELGLIGSKAQAKKIPASEKILGVINMDMIGFDSDNDGAFHAMSCDRPDSKFLADTVDQVLAGLDLPLVKEKDCTNRSDHASFWGVGVPAMIVSENFFAGDSNVCYHKACDTAAKMNFKYMTNLTTLVGNTLLALTK